MAKLILDGKKLSASIKANLGARAKVNVTSHLLACSAMMLAVKDGRCNWLNDIYAGLDRMSQDAFKAWVAPQADHWFGKGLSDEHKWIKFESKGSDGKAARGFYIAKGNTLKRPELGRIEVVADDLSVAFFNYRAAKVQQTNQLFDLEGLVLQFQKLATKLEGAANDGKIVIPARLIERAKEMATEVSKNAHLKDVPVTDEPKAEGELASGINPNPKGERAKAIVAELRDKRKANKDVGAAVA